MRTAAVFALGDSGEASAPVTQRLLALIGDSSVDAKLRYAALAALQSLGDPPDAVITALAGLVAKDPDENIRYAALDALDRLGGVPDDAAIGMLIDALNDPSWQVAEQASAMLLKSGEKGAAALAAHLASDTDLDTAVRFAAHIDPHAHCRDPVPGADHHRDRGRNAGHAGIRRRRSGDDGAGRVYGIGRSRAGGIAAGAGCAAA